MLFGQIFDIDRDGEVLLLDKTIALCPKIWAVWKHKRLGSKAIRWIAAVYDYKSPYRNLPFAERHAEVTKKFYDTKNIYLTREPEMLEAIKEYISLQFNPLIEQHNAMCEKMVLKTEAYKTLEVTESTLESINKMEVGFQKSAEAIAEQRALIIKDLEGGIKIHGVGEGGLSFLEQDYVRNPKSVKLKKPDKKGKEKKEEKKK